MGTAMHVACLYGSTFAVLFGAVFGAFVALSRPFCTEELAERLAGEVFDFLVWALVGVVALAVVLAITAVVLACKLRNARAEQGRAAV
jgi:hypothetical protein